MKSKKYLVTSIATATLGLALLTDTAGMSPFSIQQVSAQEKSTPKNGNYNYTKNDFFWLEISDMSLKEIVTKIIKPLKRNNPGLYSFHESTFSRILEVIK